MKQASRMQNICTFFFFLLLLRRSGILVLITSTIQNVYIYIYFTLKFLLVLFNSFSFCSDVMTSGIGISGQKASSVFHMKNHSSDF